MALYIKPPIETWWGTNPSRYAELGEGVHKQVTVLCCKQPQILRSGFEHQTLTHAIWTLYKLRHRVGEKTFQRSQFIFIWSFIRKWRRPYFNINHWFWKVWYSDYTNNANQKNSHAHSAQGFSIRHQRSKCLIKAVELVWIYSIFLFEAIIN